MAAVTPIDLAQSAAAAHEVILRRHQPILAFDQRELFFPISVERYLEGCELWQGDEAVLSEPTSDDLDFRFGPDSHLRFVTPIERRDVFRSEVERTARRLLSPRLGLVGLFGRIVDALFLALVMLRSTTPKATAVAAEHKAKRLGVHDAPTCYGRAVMAGEWLVLHYAWLYAMNDWRSGYRGMNDHEGDWEQAWIFCDPVDCSPQWVATSNHDYDGADLRRHWRDPEVTKVGPRPVLYAGAGSHALFFSAGDYVTRFDLPGLRWLGRLHHLARRLAGTTGRGASGVGPALGIPFVDYARGDGVRLHECELRLLDGLGWCDEFRGLWGVDTGDPLHAERGPGGPKYNRRGQIRRSWADPLGHAELHGTLPPSALGSRVNLEKIDRALDDLEREIKARGRMLPLARLADAERTDAGVERDALSAALLRRAELVGLRARVSAGFHPTEGLRDHLRRPFERLADDQRAASLVSLWAMLSIPLILAVVGVSLMVDRLPPVITTVAAVVAVNVVELLLRRRFLAVLRVLAACGAVFVAAVVVLEPVLSVSHYVIGSLLVVCAAALVFVNVAEWLRTRTTTP